MRDTLQEIPAVWPGNTIEFKGTRYVVLKVNPKNLKIQDAAGKCYNLPVLARYTVVRDPALAVTPPAAPKSDRAVGDLVRITSGRFASDKPFVVIKHQPQTNRWDVVEVNGKGAGAYRVPDSMLTDYEITR